MPIIAIVLRSPTLRQASAVLAFIMPTDTPGYRVASVETKMGQRASDTCQIAFEDCAIPAESLLGGEGQGIKLPSAISKAAASASPQCVSIARAALEAAALYSREREAFAKPLSEHQAVAFKLADMATQIGQRGGSRFRRRA